MVEPAPAGVAIVTGAAGGIGRAVVQLLRARGYSIVAEDISPRVTELAAEADGQVIPLQADVARTESARRAVGLATGTFGRLDLLVNNAGLFLRKPTEHCTDEDFDVLMATNVRGAFIHAREALPALAQTRGSIVNLASISGLVGMPGQAVYAMTKGAIVQLTRQLAIEHAPRVRVNAVAPGAIDTGFMDEALTGVPDREATLASVAASHPLGRLARAEEIAEVIAFLASPRSSIITGAVLMADGGFTAQ